MKIKIWLVRGGVSASILCALTLVYLSVSFQRNVEKVELEWSQAQPGQITNFGSTKTLSVLPLVNWHTRDNSLKGEAGVSYLIKTDYNTILFDVGFNQKRESPSPLEHNMQHLGISLDSVDMFFLSHAHLDHRGGQQWVNKNTFSMGLEQADLSDKRIFAPTATTYPNAELSIIPHETVLGEGIASLGAISRQLVMGKIEEQALVINVEGKGLVVIVGCGHQTVPKILQRISEVFNAPLYGLVGDLHYPIPKGRLSIAGINLQRILASGEGPHSPITFDTMKKEVELLKKTGLEVIALGGHDTSDQVIEFFNTEFGHRYSHVRVGESINIAE